MLGGISIWQLLIILVIVVLLFGTKKIKSLGGDLGSAVKGFKKAVSEDDAEFDDNKKVENKAAESTDTASTAQKTEHKEAN